ncbi:hypothetical protein Y032_0011g1527 [Ancylostoma ceylanicum]|uniref:Amiloride-sensitive sodium channel n=1 Tax=Ancylostoma ceylanicum TaxID=53326 RepID=A0A016VF81_9BILA|nr:hypothetical protein Y032_0011g1527 [Ancylostoma ceylanicum]
MSGTKKKRVRIRTPVVLTLRSSLKLWEKERGRRQSVDYYDIQRCEECKIECNSIVYHAYNSYGHGFSNEALTRLNKKNRSWSIPHMKSNFLTVNVFFRDMSYIEYGQIQGTSLTETLSDIGGNMGMFLGMSVITVIEIVMFCFKIGWITISKKRRDYMYQKQAREKEHEEQLEKTVEEFKFLHDHKYGSDTKNDGAGVQTLTSSASFENDAKLKDDQTEVEVDHQTRPGPTIAPAKPLSATEEEKEKPQSD